MLAPRPGSYDEADIRAGIALRLVGRSRFGGNEGELTERLRDEADRDPFEGVPDEVFDARFRYLKRHDGSVDQ